MKEKICGIYKIQNLVNDKIYIGKSVDIYGRWSHHIRMLRTNSHYNEYLQRAWNKYGENNFSFSIVQHCIIDDLDSMEVYYITDVYNSCDPDFGYNLTKGGDGLVPTDIVRKKLSDTHKKLCQDPEYIKRMSEVQKGKRASNETKEKMSHSQKEKWADPEFRQRMCNSQVGKQISEETKKKLSLAQKGRKYPERSGGNNHMARAVFCVELGMIFDAIKDAERFTGAKSANIIKCCNGVRKSAGKHHVTSEKLHWIYADEMNNSSVA